MKLMKILREIQDQNILNPDYYLADFQAIDFQDEDEIPTEKALDIIQSEINLVTQWDYPIKVYRAIDVKGGEWESDWDNNSWSTRKEVAEGFGDLIWVAMIPNESFVDVEQTIRTRVMNDGEYEINVKDEKWKDLEIVDKYRTKGY